MEGAVPDWDEMLSQLDPEVTLAVQFNVPVPLLPMLTVWLPGLLAPAVPVKLSDPAPSEIVGDGAEAVTVTVKFTALDVPPLRQWIHYNDGKCSRCCEVRRAKRQHEVTGRSQRRLMRDPAEGHGRIGDEVTAADRDRKRGTPGHGRSRRQERDVRGRVRGCGRAWQCGNYSGFNGARTGSEIIYPLSSLAKVAGSAECIYEGSYRRAGPQRLSGDVEKGTQTGVYGTWRKGHRTV